jgi:enamine deaminase RidA (YjgF/YER057c/UK114 family)
MISAPPSQRPCVVSVGVEASLCHDARDWLGSYPTNHQPEEGYVERRSINPVSWSIKLGFDQAQLVEGHQRQLVCSGQDAVDADGNPQHPGDMAAQLEMSLDNLGAVLAAADMTLANVVRLNVYTTDFDALVKQWASVRGPLREVRGSLRDHSARRYAAVHARAPRLARGNRD